MSDHGSADILTLNFFVYGDNPVEDICRISISRGITIQEFAEAIKACYRRVKREVIDNIVLFMLSNVPEDELSDLELPPESTQMRRRHPVLKYWSTESEIDDDMVQVLVQARIREQPVSPSPPSDDKLTELVNELSIRERFLLVMYICISSEPAYSPCPEQKRTKDTIRRGASASLISQASQFRAQQEDGNGFPSPIHNGRPRLKTGLPVELYHPVFSDFIRNTRHPKRPEPSDLRAVEDLLLSAQALYDVEDNRKLEMYKYLGAILDVQITQQAIKKCNAGGLILSRRSKSMGLTSGYCAIVEATNEIGTGDCDPSVQGAESYGHYWSQDSMDNFRAVSCCPSFIIAIAGPWLCILGAVYVEQVVVHPLTDFMWMGRQPHEEDRLRRITLTFVALREAIRGLDTYYQSLPGSTLPPFARFFPYIRQYQDTSFWYIRCLATDPVRPVFFAQTTSGDLIVVKFAQQYSAEAHRILMEQGLAPQLLYDSEQPLGCGMRMIVMSYVSGGNLYDFLDKCPEDKRGTAVQTIHVDIDKALRLLHAGNFVFGDLRPPNILVVKRKTDTGAMLIDFNWCSKAQEGRYPLGLNDSMFDTWATGMERGGLMEKTHDWEMLKILFK
ncbi:hypothetical protein FRC06_005896 [Ceratobasidium sp. 370]|nr:hypothetical protein FRC06_005896 [Ceratobasidium sp. 370]